jgi:DNA polymerase I-like protein with 3'-5' exonuclease and polymerase domains
LGLDTADIRYEYLVNDIPPRGGFDTFLASGAARRGTEDLLSRIEKNRPNTVLCLGSEVLQAFMKQRDVSKWRGHVLELVSGIKAIFTFDPVVAHRQRFVGIKQKPGAYYVLMRNDIRKAYKECQNPEVNFHPTPLHICTDFTDTVNRLHEMRDKARIISFDIEVIEPYDGRLMDCLSLADGERDSLCIPLWIPQGNPNDKENWGIKRMWVGSQQEQVLELVAQILESNIPKVAQNSQYDITTLDYYYGIKVQNLVWDTMVAAHALFCDLPKDLGTLISLYTNIPYHKYMIHSAKIGDRWEYSAADSIANLHVMSGQRKEMGRLDGICGKCTGGFLECLYCTKLHASKLFSHYTRVVNPIIEHCEQMHIEGVRMDERLREDVVRIETTFQNEIVRAITEVFPLYLGPMTNPFHGNVNPKSPKQLNILFYKLFKCRVVNNKGKPSMDDSAREIILKRDGRYYIQILLKACDAYIYSDAALLKFKVEMDNGRIRTKYEPAGADTGRLKSKASDVLCSGTNLQNVEKGKQRESIIPDLPETMEFLHADLYAAEAFLTLLDAGELDGLRMISGLLPEQEGTLKYEEKYGCRVMTTDESDKLKIHNWLCAYIWEKFPEEAEKANLKYKDAKQLIHAMNYNVQPPLMAKESGLPVSICQTVFNMYHTKFSGIHDRMLRIQETLRRKRSLETVLGRRIYFFSSINEELFNRAYAWQGQGTIGEITNTAMVNCRNWSGMYEEPYNKTRLNTHDGLVNQIFKGTRDECIPRVLDAFSSYITMNGLRIRIPVSIGFGPNFNEVNEEMVYFFPVEVVK